MLEDPLHSPRQEPSMVTARPGDTPEHSTVGGGPAVLLQMGLRTWTVVGDTGEDALLQAQSVAEKTSTDSEFDVVAVGLTEYYHVDDGLKVHI